MKTVLAICLATFAYYAYAQAPNVIGRFQIVPASPHQGRLYDAAFKIDTMTGAVQYCHAVNNAVSCTPAAR